MYNPDEEYKEMLNKLISICKQKNVSQYALAKATGMSTSSMSYIMAGRTKPYIYTVLMICSVLNISIGELFEKSDMFVEDGEINNLVNSYRRMSFEKRRLLQLYADMLLQYDEQL